MAVKHDSLVDKGDWDHNHPVLLVGAHCLAASPLIGFAPVAAMAPAVEPYQDYLAFLQFVALFSTALGMSIAGVCITILLAVWLRSGPGKRWAMLSRIRDANAMMVWTCSYCLVIGLIAMISALYRSNIDWLHSAPSHVGIWSGVAIIVLYYAVACLAPALLMKHYLSSVSIEASRQMS